MEKFQIRYVFDKKSYRIPYYKFFASNSLILTKSPSIDAQNIIFIPLGT